MSVTSWAIGARECDLADSGVRPTASELVDLGAVPPQAWAALADRAVEPNAFFQHAWTRAVSAHARGQGGARCLLVWDNPARNRLIGLLPVVSAWRAFKLPIPVLVGWQAYAPLTVPLLDAEHADIAARGLLEAAAGAGARAVLFPMLTSGPSAHALRRAAAASGLMPRAMDPHARATLDATQDAEAVLKAALGAKKLKELRRQRHRLADRGEVTFAVASSRSHVDSALDDFLRLEEAGWKGARGTALARHAGDAAFIRRAVSALAAEGRAEIVTLLCGGSAVASGILLRHNRRAYFFKIAYDEALAKTSPGVQLCLDVTQHLCADGGVDEADSIAVANHPMIDHIWRGRMAMANLLVPVRPGAWQFNLFGRLIATRSAARGAARDVVRSIRARQRRKP